MRISEFTDEQAQQLRDFIIRREPARLSDLAYWMKDTRGPVELMDGSLDSLVPLWEWFVRFVNTRCPGVPKEAVPESFQRYVPHLTQSETPGKLRDRWRVHFAAESLLHYLLAVVRRLDNTARWEVYFDANAKKRGIPSFHDQNTGIFMSRPRPYFVWPPVYVMSNHVLDVRVLRRSSITPHQLSTVEPTALLRTMVDYYLPKAILPESQSREASILLPYLAVPHVPWDAPERVPPRLNEDLRAPVPPEEESDYGHWLIARRPPEDYIEQMNSGVPEMSLYPPLDADRLAAGLAKLGFVDPKGQPVTAATLVADEGGTHPDHGMMVSDFVYEGSVRQLWIEGQGFAPIVAALQRDLSQLAKSVGAELTEGH